jgi:hypothetical protein
VSINAELDLAGMLTADFKNRTIQKSDGNGASGKLFVRSKQIRERDEYASIVSRERSRE